MRSSTQFLYPTCNCSSSPSALFLLGLRGSASTCLPSWLSQLRNTFLTQKSTCSARWSLWDGAFPKKLSESSFKILSDSMRSALLVQHSGSTGGTSSGGVKSSPNLTVSAAVAAMQMMNFPTPLTLLNLKPPAFAVLHSLRFVSNTVLLHVAFCWLCFSGPPKNMPKPKPSTVRILG